MAAITVLGTVLKWGATDTAATQVIDITGIPEMGAAPNTHDVSTTVDTTQVNILGRQPLEALEFDFFVDADAANFTSAQADETIPLFYNLSINNGLGGVIKWQGEHTVRLLAADGDNPLKATVTVVASTEPVHTAA